jgi:hypothetical protein
MARKLSRKMSMKPAEKKDTREKKENDDLIAAEDKDSGSVTLKDIANYLSFSVGPCFGFFIYFFICTVTSIA